MKSAKFLKILSSLSLICAVSLNAEVDIAEQAKQLYEKQKSRKTNAETWLEQQEEYARFDREEWEALREKEYQERLKKLTKSSQKIAKREGRTLNEKDKKYDELAARELTNCSIKDRFFRTTGSRAIMEYFSLGEDVKQYREFLANECSKAEKAFEQYLEDRDM